MSESAPKRRAAPRTAPRTATRPAAKTAAGKKTPGRKASAKKAPAPKKAAKRAAAPRHHHSVYVIELHPAVWNSAKFRVANPGHDHAKPCVYVGSTGLSPEARFAKHKAGIKANRFVQEHGLRLLPQLYAVYNPMPYAAALEMEVEVADALREQGFAVWQG